MAITFSTRFASFILLIAILSSGNPTLAQETHHYTIQSGQPPALLAHAGEDVVFSEDEVLVLSGLASGGTEPYSYSWTPTESLSDAEIAGPTVTGANADVTYTLTVIDGMGCRATDNVTVFGGIITSVPSKKEIPFTIHSEPSGEYITIRGSLRDATVQLLDTRGNTVLNERITLNEHRLHTANFPTGIYLLRISVGRDLHIVKLFVP